MINIKLGHFLIVLGVVILLIAAYCLLQGSVFAAILIGFPGGLFLCMGAIHDEYSRDDK